MKQRSLSKLSVYGLLRKGGLTFILLNALVQISLAQGLKRFEYSAPKMGTKFRLVFYAEDSSVADQMAKKAFFLVDSMNMIFSNYDPQSEINVLTRQAINGKMVEVSEPLWEVLVFSKRCWRKSKGAFDVTIGPLSKLWRRAFKRKEFPDEKRLEKAKSLVNFKLIKFSKSKRSIGMKQIKMALDFGGIAKGYTADQVALLFELNNIKNYLIDAGGDITVGDAPPNKMGWSIQNMNGKDELLVNASIAVSGDKYRYLKWNGKRYSHIIDPRTGLGILNQMGVAVVANSGMEADAFASACSILGPEKSGRIAAKNGFKVYFYQPSEH